MITRNFHLREGREPSATPTDPPPERAPPTVGLGQRLGALIRRLAQRPQPEIKKVAPVADSVGSPTALTSRSA